MKEKEQKKVNTDLSKREVCISKSSFIDSSLSFKEIIENPLYHVQSKKKVNKDVPLGEVLITLSPSMKQNIESKKILESLPLMEQTKKK